MVLGSLIVRKPKMSLVLTRYLEQCKEPAWTSFFIKFKDVENDQKGLSHFNWTLDTGANYHILRTGAFPYMKYHCTKRPFQDLSFDNNFYRLIKIINLGIPQLMYGMAAIYLIRHTELVHVDKATQIPIYFLYEEDKGSRF